MARRMTTPSTVDEALHQTITDMLNGTRIEGTKETSYEVLHYRTGMTKPRARIAAHPARSLNIVGAIARFVWMIAGSNRLEDIAYYEEKVRGYTDNDLTVPGSSYGKRLFDAAPGLDQIQGAIARLDGDRDTRQAAAVVWVPEDAVRASNDIPCTFGMFFHIRNDQLVMCTVMRSNNAFRLLPFNFFEFSLLGEMIAATLNVPFGEYVHFAASMHIYDNFEMDKTRQLAADGPAQSVEMPPMPGTDHDRLKRAAEIGDERAQELATPIGQATELARLEAQLRHAHNAAEFDAVLTAAGNKLNDYWLALFKVLAAWGAAKRELPALVEQLTAELPAYLRARVQAGIAKAFPQVTQTHPATGGEQQGTLDFDLALDLPTFNPAAAAAAQAAQEAATLAAVEAVVDFHRREPFDIAKLPRVVKSLSQNDVALAARSEVRSEGARSDRFLFTEDMIRTAIARVS
ncbi:thymidylate synthase [Mycolicibacterium senegalense]|uniref:thymidylate synthase n=1 Tax=Mycolicibacterium senegalense TaxID=1796 RepID=UPI003640CC2A